MADSSNIEGESSNCGTGDETSEVTTLVEKADDEKPVIIDETLNEGTNIGSQNQIEKAHVDEPEINEQSLPVSKTTEKTIEGVLEKVTTKDSDTAQHSTSGLDIKEADVSVLPSDTIEAGVKEDLSEESPEVKTKDGDQNVVGDVPIAVDIDESLVNDQPLSVSAAEIDESSDNMATNNLKDKSEACATTSDTTEDNVKQLSSHVSEVSVQADEKKSDLSEEKMEKSVRSSVEDVPIAVDSEEPLVNDQPSSVSEVEDNSAQLRSHVAEVSKQIECVNLHCESGVGLTDAPVFVMTYYGVRYRKNVMQRVCDACYLAAENHYVSLCGMLKSGEPLLRADFPGFKDDVVVMDKVEELCEEQPLPIEITSMVEDNFNVLLRDVMVKCNLDFQVNESTYILNAKFDELEATVKAMGKEYEEIENTLTKVRKAIYAPYKPTYHFVAPIDLTDPHLQFEKLVPLSQCPEKIPKPPSIPKCALPPNVIIPSDPTDVVALAEYTIDRAERPTGPVKYTPLACGSPVYIIRSSSFGIWLKGVVTEINGGNYRVKFDTYRSGYSKTVTGNHLAYTKPSELAYPIATRVIAKFHDTQNSQNDAYYVGIIAEPQKYLNKFRYLVFFDDGYAQYVTHENIFPVCKVSPNVWDDVHVGCKEFIKNYLTQYPERPMVRLQPGQIVRTEWHGKWWAARVAEIDASLVRMDFENSDRSEWIYRGSTRLKPLYDQLVVRARSIGTSFLKKKNMPYVEYSVEQDYSQDQSGNAKAPQPGRNVAKKSTTGRTNGHSPLLDKPILPLGADEETEFPSKGIIRRMDLSTRIKSQEYRHHMCNRSCVSWTSFGHKHARYIPPLCIPLMNGFTRLLLRTKMKRMVVYTAPCGRKLRSMSELHTYLMTTNCNMGVDLFDFDHWVRVTDEFHLEPSMYKTHIADISDGVENMAVSCVNEIFDAWPQVMLYATQRLPQKGVKLNTDKEFMVCCDCIDDCSNKEKCACWQLTIAGTLQGPDAVLDPSVGYYYRRLAEPVNTGIYECHSGCRCLKSTCQNRVVQHPLSQRLQVFRTLRKGWGLRTLNDIPLGAFICIYVGRLHTEASANEGGRVYGDEYLAELDYIEVVEQFKEGYENDVADTEDEKDDDEEHDVMVSNWERREMDKDKEFQPDLTYQKSNQDRSISTRAKAAASAEDLNTITISDDDEDVNRQMSKFTANVPENNNESATKGKNVRELLGDSKDDIYIMDAKYEGNIGRYLNHSCQPNVFVQNVFVDTHDIRFPWISFFAMSHIRAGTELTWDYNYNIGSVAEKVLYCYCGTPECRGRLL